MHDIVKYVANRIAFRDHHKLTSVVDGDDEGELKEWPEKDFLDKCTSISFPRGNNTLMLPQVLQCPVLKMFLLKGDTESKISPKLFEETKKLTVLALESMNLRPLPSSFQFLKEMQTLCLEQCELEDVTLVGELSNLKVLSFVGSEFTHLPQEIAKLTRLRLLDLSDCYLRVIPHGVLSSLTRLEDLRMKNFYSWETEGEGTNASLLELKELSRLVTLQIQIPKQIILPADLFSDCKLERYYIYIGTHDRESYHPFYEVDITHNTLCIGNNIQLDKGIKLLLKKCEDLYLYRTFGTYDHPLDAQDFQQVKLLSLSLYDKVVFPNLATLTLNGWYFLKYLLTSFTARSLVELKHLEVTDCGMLEEIVVSTKEDGEENMTNVFTKLESLKLHNLPELGRFCRSSTYIEFKSLKTLMLAGCNNLESFVSKPMSSEENDAAEKLDVERKIAEQLKGGEEKNRDGSESEENRDSAENDRTGVGLSLFNEKVAFPSLERLEIYDSKKLNTIWDDQIAHPAGSFCRLNYVNVKGCPELINVFPRSIQGRLTALETIEICECESVQGVFESKDTIVVDVEDAHIVETSAPREPFFNCDKLESISVRWCKSLKYIFPATMARGGLVQLRELVVESCDKLNVIIAGGDDDRVSEASPPPQFVFPKVTYLTLKYVHGFESLYPGTHTSKC